MIQRTDKRMRICITLLLLNLLVIWGNSLLPGSVSGALSQWLRDVISTLIPGASQNPQAGHGLLRKLAHFTEFCCLGICFSWLVRMLRRRQVEFYVLPLLGGLTAACVDETIQRFVPGRGPSMTDVGIDTTGAALGIALLSFAYVINKRRKTNYAKETQR